ncbi:SDR family oxidoreductase [Geminicoccaceae bacterium 1502E]|nr:SDR family oxidoreductase [Geminicoccaceae bacterium 1502E]
MLTPTRSRAAAPHGVRVPGLAPGASRTPIDESPWRDPVERKDLDAKTPRGRIGEREEIASMAVMLVFDAASYVTGTTGSSMAG